MQFVWLTAFWPITRESEFCQQIWDWWWNMNYNNFHSRLFPAKTNNPFFQKNPKNNTLGQFSTLSSKIWVKIYFPEKRTKSAFKYSNILLSCTKSEKTKEPFLRKMLNGQTNEQAYRRIAVIYRIKFIFPFFILQKFYIAFL